MKQTFLIALACFLVSCEENTKEKKVEDIAVEKEVHAIDQAQPDTLINSSIDTLKSQGNYAFLLDSPLYFLPEEIDFLRGYFTDSIIVAYDSCQMMIAEIKTDKEFEIAYLKLLKLREQLAEQIYSKNLPEEINDDYYPNYVIQEFQKIDEAVTGIVSTCVAECTEFDFTIDLSKLKTIAQNSEGDIDDKLFDIFDLADGDYGGTGFGWHNWFARTWDYGGASLFGEGIHLAVLQKINLVKEKTDVYDNLLSIYQESVLSDIQHGIYMHSKSEALTEIKSIIELEFLSTEEKSSLNSLLNEWENGDGTCKNCVDGKYQFDCLSGDCNWGG